MFKLKFLLNYYNILIQNKEINEISYETNQLMETNSKKQISMEYKELTECMNCFAHPSIQVNLNNEVLPEMSGNYSVSFNNIMEYY